MVLSRVRLSIQKAMEEQKMKKALAAGLCQCPFETERVREAITTRQFDLDSSKMKTTLEYILPSADTCTTCDQECLSMYFSNDVVISYLFVFNVCMLHSSFCHLYFHMFIPNMT